MKPFKFHTLIALVAAAVMVLFAPCVRAGDLLVCSSGNSSVKRYNQTTGAFVGNFTVSAPSTTDLTYGPDGNLYVSTNVGLLSDVKRYDGQTGAFIDDFIPLGYGDLKAAGGMAFGPDGNLYIGSHGAQELGGSSVKRYNGTTGVFMGDFVPLGSGGLWGPIGLTFGPDGNLYVISRFTHSVKRYDGGTGTYMGDFVLPNSGGLSAPMNLTFGPDGDLYVASYFTNSVKRYHGVTGDYLGDFVAPGSGGISETYDVVFGSDGNLYVNKAGGPGGVWRYNGTTGAFIDIFVTPGSGGMAEPRGMVFMPSPDTTPPTVSCSVVKSMLWPPNHNLVNVGLSVSVSDDTDPNPTIQVKVFGDEDDEEPTGDGVHSPDAKDIASGSLRLRSERKGNADGRVYLIVVSATDASGNVGFDCCTVVVPRSQSKKDVNDANAQALAAELFCLASGGAAPPGYFTIGDGPTIGPKQ